MQSSCQSQSWYLDPKTYPGTCAMKSFFISSRSAPSVVTPVFLYSSPSRRRSQTSQHKLSVLKSRFISPLTEDHRIHNELLQINKINCNFLATDERFTYVNCCSVAKLCPTLWPHGLQHARLPCISLSPEFAQTHVHWVADAIQPSHPL